MQLRDYDRCAYAAEPTIDESTRAHCTLPARSFQFVAPQWVATRGTQTASKVVDGSGRGVDRICDSWHSPVTLDKDQRESCLDERVNKEIDPG
jgi:hypothetical protein